MKWFPDANYNQVPPTTLKRFHHNSYSLATYQNASGNVVTARLYYNDNPIHSVRYNQLMDLESVFIEVKKYMLLNEL